MSAKWPEDSSATRMLLFVARATIRHNLSQYIDSYSPFVHESVVMLLLRGALRVEPLADSPDSLRGLPQREALSVVAQVKVPPVEDLADVAGVAGVEAYPRGVRCKSIESDYSIVQRDKPRQCRTSGASQITGIDGRDCWKHARTAHV